TACQRSAYIAKTVDFVSQRMHLLPVHAKLVLDIEHTRRGNHQVRLNIGYAPQRLQHAHCINRPGCPSNAYDQPAQRVHASAPASFRVVSSSPFSYISAMMSDPPTNSPPTYSWGIVGQLENSLMPWRTSSSSSTLTVTSLVTPDALSTWMARPEKPHCGNWAVPFMNSTTGLEVTVSRMKS